MLCTQRLWRVCSRGDSVELKNSPLPCLSRESNPQQLLSLDQQQSVPTTELQPVGVRLRHSQICTVSSGTGVEYVIVYICVCVCGGGGRGAEVYPQKLWSDVYSPDTTHMVNLALKGKTFLCIVRANDFFACKKKVVIVNFLPVSFKVNFCFPAGKEMYCCNVWMQF